MSCQKRSSRASRSSVRPITTSRATDHCGARDEADPQRRQPRRQERHFDHARVPKAHDPRGLLEDLLSGERDRSGNVEPRARRRAAGRALAPARSTTSSIATGCVRDFSQRGRTMNGKRAARSRTMSQLRLPCPTIMLARSSTVLTEPARSASPTSSRLRRCSEPAPARGDAAEIDDALDAGGGGRLGEGRGRRDLAPVVVRALADPVHEIERGLAPVERASARGRIPHVALHPVERGLALLWPAPRLASGTARATPRERGAGLTAPPTKPVAPVRRSERSTMGELASRARAPLRSALTRPSKADRAQRDGRPRHLFHAHQERQPYPTIWTVGTC